MSALRGPGGVALHTAGVRVHRVEWVDVNAPFEPDKPSEKPNFRPDPLPPVDPTRDRFSVEANRNLVFWIALEVPEAARPGEYRGSVNLLQGDAPAAAGAEA